MAYKANKLMKSWLISLRNMDSINSTLKLHNILRLAPLLKTKTRINLIMNTRLQRKSRNKKYLTIMIDYKSSNLKRRSIETSWPSKTRWWVSKINRKKKIKVCSLISWKIRYWPLWELCLWWRVSLKRKISWLKEESYCLLP